MAFLRSLYPEAFIKGIDISPGRIRHCRKTLADARTQFEAAASAGREPPEHYHAIFACSVFRHADLGHGPPSCEGVLSFTAFESTVGGLVRCLRPGGYLVIRHANFRFQDAGCAADFELVAQSKRALRTPVYGRDDRLLPASQVEPCVFRKRAAAQE